MKQVRALKIVVASPGDVQAERDMIPAIVDELNKGLADERGVRLEVYRWETDAYPAFHPREIKTDNLSRLATKNYLTGPQGQIDSCLHIEDCDLLIAIFWKRFGTPVLDAQSGTEHEIRLALEACEKMGRPQLMIYFNQAPHKPQSQAEKDQWQQVLDFKQSLSQKVLWWEYNSKDQFRDFVHQHLTKFIRGDYSGRPLEELLQAYHDHLTRRVSTVRIFGEAETRPLEKVFVELTLTEEYERPTRNAQWLGLMDAELRRRRDIFARDDEDRELGLLEKERKKEKRTLKPDDLSRRRTQAVIVGAPGCGKTTLLRYLALKTLQAGKRFPVFLELKSLSEKAFEAAEGNLVELLFAKAVAAPLSLSAAETERCKAFFLARLKAGEVTIFLDGLDEVAGATFFSALCRSVNEFMSSAYRNNDLIISTRPYALQQRFEGLQEMEIASLNPRRIEAFLQHYYGDDPTTKELQQELRRRRELREMAESLNFVNLRLRARSLAYVHNSNREYQNNLIKGLIDFIISQKTDERPYALAVIDSFSSATGHSLKYLLKKLRGLSRDPNEFVRYRAILALARIADQRTLDILIKAFRNKAGYIQKIAAKAIGMHGNKKAMNALLIALKDKNKYVHSIETVIEGLGNIGDKRIVNSLLKVSRYADSDTCKVAARVAYEKDKEFVAKKLAVALENDGWEEPMNAAFAIGGTRDESAVDVLVKALCHEDEMVCWAATIALGNIGGEKALKGLLIAIKHRNAEVRREATELLGCENVDQTTRNALIKALKDKNSLVRLHAACALARIGYKQALDALISALKNRKNNGFERGFVAFWLGELGGKQALQALLRALNDHDWQLRAEIAAALGKFKEKVSLQALLKLLKDNVEGVRTDAAISLGKIGDKRVLKYLIEALADKSIYVRCAALRGLLQIDPISCTKFLLTALNDEAEEVQDFSTKLLEKIDERTLVFTLIQALEQEDACVKYRATKVSGYSVTDRRFLQKLQQLADTDSSKKVRTAAREAAEKYANKLRYFGG